MENKVRRLPSQTFAVGLRLARASRGITTQELARRSGLSPGFLIEIQAGNKAPTTGIVECIATALETPASEIWRRGEEENERGYWTAAAEAQRQLARKHTASAVLSAIKFLSQGELLAIAEAIEELSDEGEDSEQ